MGEMPAVSLKRSCVGGVICPSVPPSHCLTWTSHQWGTCSQYISHIQPACQSCVPAAAGLEKKQKTMTCQNFSNHHIPARSTPTGKDHPIYPHLTRDKPRILTSWECFSSAEDSDLQTQIVWWTFYCVKKTLIRKSKSVHVRMSWDSTLQLGVSVRE